MTEPVADTAGLEDDGREMTFTEHLGELRDRLVRVAGVIMLGFFVAFAYRDPLFEFMAAPMKEALAQYGIYNFRAIEITETIFVYLKLSVVASIICTLPYSFFQMWAFVAPGLLEQEKRAVAPLIFFSTFFFVLGAWFAYKVIIPFIAMYLAELTVGTGEIAMDVTVKSAFGFSVKLFLAFGIAFELPLVMFFLAFLGLVDAKKYIGAWRYFVVVSFIIAAVFTPPDPISQLLMAIPLNVLYWVGVAAALFVGAKRDGKARSFVIPSRVWGMLTVSLMLVGSAIAGGTWWLGQDRSPLSRVPADAVWVASLRIDTTLGPDASEDRTNRLRGLLGLPADAPAARQVVMAEGPDGQALTILVHACAAETPPIGVCKGDDLLLGDAEWADSSSEESGRMSDQPTVRDLLSRGPAWLWDRSPAPDRLALLPGMTSDSGVDLDHFAAVVSLSPDDAWLELRATPKDKTSVTALQNRVDLWRAEDARKRDEARRRKQTRQADAVLLRLFDQLVTLSDERFALLKGDIDEHALEKLAERERTLRAALRLHLKGLDAAAEAPNESGTSALERLGRDAVTDWKTAADDGTLVVRLDLSTDGIDALLRGAGDAR